MSGRSPIIPFILILVIAVAGTYYFTNLLNSQTPIPQPTPTPTIGPTPTPSIGPTPTPTIGPTPTPSTNPTPTPPITQPQETVDLNWAGYVTTSDLQNPQPEITGITGSWTVPQVEPTSIDTFSAVWVGIGGLYKSDLIQTGTEQDYVNGTYYYSAWYELLPNPSIELNMQISPGDTITAIIELVNPGQDVWSIQLKDETTGETFSKEVYYVPDKLSAEWVVERPDVNNALSYLANFTDVTMYNCDLKLNNQNASIDNSPSAKIIMSDRLGNQMVNVSALSSDGKSFTITFLKSK